MNWIDIWEQDEEEWNDWIDYQLAHNSPDDGPDDCLGCGQCDDCIERAKAHYDEMAGSPSNPTERNP